MTVTELYEMAEEDDIKVFDFRMNRREALSIMDVDGRCYIAIDRSRISSETDEKMKMAHELGHCETGAFYNVYSNCDRRQRHEVRAQKWAVKKLISEDELNGAVSAGCTEVWQLAEFFGVSEAFIRQAVSWYRYGNLDDMVG